MSSSEAPAPVPESVVAEVVREVSERMGDPGYAQVAIGSFAEAHPDAGRYVTAQLDELGSGEAVMHTVFHAEVLNECFRRHLGRDLTPVRFRDLDRVARVGSDAFSTLRACEPALADYLASNVDAEAMQKLLALIGLAMNRAAARRVTE